MVDHEVNKVSQKQRNDLRENKVPYGIFLWIIVHNYSGFFVFAVCFVIAAQLLFFITLRFVDNQI